MKLTWPSFVSAVESAGLAAVQRSATHWQIVGGLRLVNVYPEARTFYVQGTAKGRRIWKHNWSEPIGAAVQIQVSYGPKKERLSKEAAKWMRTALLRRDSSCHWCKCRLSRRTATLDHVIPLSKGGGNGMDNVVLACHPCNQRRANNVTSDDLASLRREMAEARVPGA